MTPRKRKLVILATFLLILAIISWKGWGIFMAYEKKKYMANMKTDVVVAVAKSHDWQTKIQASGTLSAAQGVMLKSQVAGNVTKMYFHSGDTVKAGDVLLEIDPGILKAKLAASQATADLNSGDYDRAIALFKRGALSKQDLDTALANKASAEANLQEVKAQLAQNIITAPFDGKLGITQYNLGDYINIGQSLVNLQQIDMLRVDFSVPQNQATDINPGDTVTVQTDDSADQIVQGHITAVDTAVDINTRTVAVRARINNPGNKLLPGGFAQVTVDAGSQKMLVTIPQIAVVYDSNGNYVYKIVNGKAVKTPVNILQSNKHDVAVTGLNTGDEVVTQGQLKISDGANVNAIH